MTIFHVVMAFVVVQRLAELAWSARNTRRLLAHGATEVGPKHYPLFVLLHGSWLIALALTVPAETPPHWPLLGVFVLLQMLRVWIIATLGSYWTTRIITLQTAPLVRNGPFRWLRHPNYAVVVGEIAVLPLTFGAWQIALVWSLLNALLLRHRIRVEETALQSRRNIRPAPGF